MQESQRRDAELPDLEAEQRSQRRERMTILGGSGSDAGVGRYRRWTHFVDSVGSVAPFEIRVLLSKNSAPSNSVWFSFS